MSSVLFSNKAFGKYKKESDDDDSFEEEEENQQQGQRQGPPKASTEVRGERTGIKSPTSEFDYDDLFDKPSNGVTVGGKNSDTNGRSASGLEKSPAVGGLSVTSGALRSQDSSANSANANDDAERGNGASGLVVKIDSIGSSSSQQMSQNNNSNLAKRHQRSSVTYSTTSPMLPTSSAGRPKDVVNSSAFARVEAPGPAPSSTKPVDDPKGGSEKKPAATATNSNSGGGGGKKAAPVAVAAAAPQPAKDFSTIEDFFADDANSGDEFDEGVFEERSLGAGPAATGKPAKKAAVEVGADHLADTSDSSSSSGSSSGSDEEENESKPQVAVGRKADGPKPGPQAPQAKPAPVKSPVVPAATTITTTTTPSNGPKADRAAGKGNVSSAAPQPAENSDSDDSEEDEDMPFTKNTKTQINREAVAAPPAATPSKRSGGSVTGSNSTSTSNNTSIKKVPTTPAQSTSAATVTSSKSALLEAASADMNNTTGEKPIELFDSSDDDDVADAQDQQRGNGSSNGSSKANDDENKVTETDVSQSLSAVAIVKPPPTTSSVAPVVGVAPPPPAPPATAAAAPAAPRSTRASTTTSDGLPVFVVPSTKDLSSVVAAEAKLNSGPIDASVVRPIASYSVKTSKGSSLVTNDTDSSLDASAKDKDDHDDEEEKATETESPTQNAVATPKQPEKSTSSAAPKEAKEKGAAQAPPPKPQETSAITFRPMTKKGEKPFSDEAPPVQIKIASGAANDDDTFDQFSEPGGSPLLPHDGSGPKDFSAQPAADLRTPVTFITAKESAIPASRRAAPSRPSSPASLPPINFVQAIGLLIRDAGTWAHAGPSTAALGSAHPKKKSKGFFGKLMGLCSSSSSTTEAVSEPSPKGNGRPTEDPLRVHLTTCARDGGVEFLEALLRLQLDHTNNIHRRVFISMCRRLLRMAPDANDPPTRNSQCWERIGFQGEDPATDLRSTGMLGPMQVLYLMDAFPSLTANMWNICTSNPSAELPFVLVCFNMTGIVVEAYKTGKLKKEISERVKLRRQQKGQDGSASNRAASAEPPRPGTSPASPNSITSPATAPPVIEVLCELFVGSAAVFLASWKKLPETPTVREFGKVKATVKEYVMKNISETMKKGAPKP